MRPPPNLRDASLLDAPQDEGGLRYGSMPCRRIMLRGRRGWIMPRRSRFVLLPLVAATLAAAPGHAGDVEPFLAGAIRSCIECDLAGRDLKERDFKRAKLDRAKLRDADLSRASLVRA